jgi:hypothetical protein
MFENPFVALRQIIHVQRGLRLERLRTTLIKYIFHYHPTLSLENFFDLVSRYRKTQYNIRHTRFAAFAADLHMLLALNSVFLYATAEEDFNLNNVSEHCKTAWQYHVASDAIKYVNKCK